VSYLKDLPCAGCGTESTYYFPDKPTAHYCYCEFRFEIGEQIAQEILEDSSPITGDFKIVNLQNVRDGIEWARARYAAIAKREPNQVTKDAIEEARKMK